ncbi:asparagine synthase C-terminal domain-containing protein [Streptomyces sp. NPDC002044]|uniref:asparagine synthase C-terminal domain-containing protein n=1 Tax=Streptomyces sp. NPDC002044 TaxID=3154662 RepID=UPI00331F6154
MLALIGTHSLSSGELSSRMKKVNRVSDIEHALEGARGSFSVVGSCRGTGYARGSASGARRIYHTSIDGATIGADRARTLAWLKSAEIDREQLAARIAFPVLPHPVAGRSMWTGVHSLPVEESLTVERDGSHRTATWWQAPPAELTLAEGSALLRDELRAAVSARLRPGELLGVDLSGMDSTSLCYLAAESGARLVTSTVRWSAPGNEDHAYALTTHERLKNADTLLFESGDLPGFFTGMGIRHEPSDEPFALQWDRASSGRISHAIRSLGASMRLSGHGGDHVVQPPVSYLRHVLRENPWTALRHVSGWRAHNRWSLKATGHLLLDRRPYSTWLAEAGGRLRERDALDETPEPWGYRPQLPPWASDVSVELLRGLLRTASHEVEPLAPVAWRHAWIKHVQEAGAVAKLLAHTSDDEGLRIESPYCDDGVVNACLSVRPDQARAPWSYKPLLAAAMRGIVPETHLRRESKDHCGQEWFAGLRSHQRDLASWVDTSLLVEMGIVDRENMRRAMLNPYLLSGGAAQLNNTLGAEEWLRDLSAFPTPRYMESSHKEVGS